MKKHFLLIVILAVFSPFCIADSVILSKDGNQFSSTSGSYATSTHCVSGDTCLWISGNQVIVGVYNSYPPGWGGTVRWDFDLGIPVENVGKAYVTVDWPSSYGKGLHSTSSSGSGSISAMAEGNIIASLTTNVATCGSDYFAHSCGTYSLTYEIPLSLIESTTKIYVKTGSTTAWDVKSVKLTLQTQQCTSGPCCDTATGKYKASGSQPTGYSDFYDCDGSNSPTGTNYVRLNDYYCNGADTSQHLQTSTADTCGVCEYCESGQSSCKYYSSSESCGTCKLCNGAGSCSGIPSDDSGCGNIDCSSWYLQTGIEGPLDTEYCYNKNDITSNRCEGFGDCKDSNTADCSSQANDAMQYSCGACKYITASSCTSTTLGSCTNYASGTSCGTGKQCDGSGNCGNIPQCDGTDTSCGIYPSCLNCNSQDSCNGDYYRNYYCSSNQAGCTYTSDNCNDCSCSCGNYNQNEANFCSDGKDNDCDGLTDVNDYDCCQNDCVSNDKRCNGNYKQVCGNYDSDPCSEWGGDVYCQYGCMGGACKLSKDITIENGKILINNNPFLVKGVDYAPWLSGTGPDPYLHSPFPGEYDDVTSKVRHDGKIYVKDYSGDGKIQAWEVIQYDMETIKGIGANTIRTYASGGWHDKNLDGDIDMPGTPEQNEFAQGDLPNWALDRIVDFCENNSMMVIIGYWVQEEDFKAGLQCNWDDLNVAKDTLKRVVERYSSSPAVLAWGIGNEVHGSWNYAWFTWAVDINDYLNALFSYVKGIDAYNKPIMYAKYIGENTNFNNLNADIISPNAYTFTADELVSMGEFSIAAPQGKAYLIGEFGHIIEQAEGHWNLSKKYAGGCFLEYNNVWWKGDNQNILGLVDEYRNINPGRYYPVYYLFNEDILRRFTIQLKSGWNLISFPLDLAYKKIGGVFSSYIKVFTYKNGWMQADNNTEINESLGYWVNVQSGYSLEIRGKEFSSMGVNNRGLILIGYKSLEEKNISQLFSNVTVHMYNNSKWYSYVSGRSLNSFTKFTPGYGYWVKK